MANPKVVAVSKPAPKMGWGGHGVRERLLSQLDAATGRLTGDQQQYYADLPIEEFSVQPSTSNKLIQSDDGSVEYHQLQPYDGAWRNANSGPIVVNGAVRP